MWAGHTNAHNKTRENRGYGEKTMKYLIAADNYMADRPGGVARVSWDIAQLAHEQGHDLTFVVLARPNATFSEPYQLTQESERIRVLRVKRPKLPKWNPRRMQAATDAVTKAVQDTIGHETWDRFHSHTPIAGLGTLNGLKRRPPVYATIHSPMGLEYIANTNDKGWLRKIKTLVGVPLLNRVERELLDQCDSIHVLSQYTRVHLERDHGVGDKVTIIPHWRRPDLERTLSKAEAREKLGWPQDETIFFTVRKHGPRNGLDISLHAIAPLIHQNQCRYFLAGDGPLRSYHEELTKELNMTSRVHFMGRIPDQELSWAYQAADVFMLPTLALECFGLIIIEAFAFGCPIISSNAGAIPESMLPILPHHVFPSGDMRALRDKMKKCVSGKLPTPSAEEIIDYTERRFGKEVIAPQILNFLEL